MNESTSNFIKQWIDKANEDLLVVEKLTEPEIVAPSSACFPCQQAVEKFLKAFLISKDVEIKRTHNIEFLLSECSDIDDSFSGIDVKNLSECGVETRYPGDSYNTSLDEIFEYKNLAFRIKELVGFKIDMIFKSTGR